MNAFGIPIFLFCMNQLAPCDLLLADKFRLNSGIIFEPLDNALILEDNSFSITLLFPIPECTNKLIRKFDSNSVNCTEVFSSIPFDTFEGREEYLGLCHTISDILLDISDINQQTCSRIT